MILTRFAAASDGIAREEELLASEPPRLILWQADQTALVVPKSWTRRLGFAAAEVSCVAEGWPLIARSSGGGGVPQGLSTVNLALVVPVHQGFTLDDGYRLICGAIAEALTRFNIAINTGCVEGSFCDGAWNVTVGGKKLGGTAQRWCVRTRGKVALIHAAILLEMPAQSFWRALDHIHRAAGVTNQIRPDAHVALRTILPRSISEESMLRAVLRAAEGQVGLLGRTATSGALWADCTKSLRKSPYVPSSESSLDAESYFC